jgi:5-formyltetrahydrofolate cyclo-ligase
VEARRRSLSPAEVARRGGEVQRHLAALAVWSPGLVAALYEAQAFEVPLTSLAGELARRGVRLAFPRVERGTRVLAFHEGLPRDDWPVSRFGLREPPATAPRVAPGDIDVFLVPGVAFSPQGARLGRGGGYYDATLPLARPGARRIGVAFDCQIVTEIPLGDFDERVDAIATERGVFDATSRR